MEQRFSLPGLPLHRDLQTAVTIGTQFSVRATPIDHEQRRLSFALVTINNEAALEIDIQLPDKQGGSSKLTALSRSAISESSHQEKDISTIAVDKELVLGVIVKEHVFEIYLDSYFFLSFVHRVNPSEITKIVLDGAVICSEVVIVPANADLPPLPAYSELNPSPHRTDRPPPPQLPSHASRPPRAASQEPPQQQLQHFHSCSGRRGPIAAFVSALETRGRGRRGAMRGRCGRGGKRHGSASPATSTSCFENSNY